MARLTGLLYVAVALLSAISAVEGGADKGIIIPFPIFGKGKSAVSRPVVKPVRVKHVVVTKPVVIKPVVVKPVVIKRKVVKPKVVKPKVVVVSKPVVKPVVVKRRNVWRHRKVAPTKVIVLGGGKGAPVRVYRSNRPARPAAVAVATTAVATTAVATTAVATKKVAAKPAAVPAPVAPVDSPAPAAATAVAVAEPAVQPEPAPVPKPAAKAAAAAAGFPTILAAAEAGKLTTLIAAIKAADLTGPVTDGSSEFTVFAPTDDAFAALLKTLDTTAEKLLANKELLTKVLTYHLVPGPAVLSSAITDGASVNTLLKDGKLTLKVADGKVSVVGGDVTANVVKADIPAGKAVVHVIDAVLVPK